VSLPDPRLQLQSLSTEQDHQLRGANFFERKRCLLVVASDMPPHAQKNGARRALAAFKRASNNSCFGPWWAPLIAQLQVIPAPPTSWRLGIGDRSVCFRWNFALLGCCLWWWPVVGVGVWVWAWLMCDVA
jgi:hypothetical protein